MSFVRSFVLCGHEPSLLWTAARRPSAGPVCLPLEERRGIGWCMRCDSPPALVQRWPRRALMRRSQRLVTSFCLGHVSTADILTLLIKMPARVTDFRGHPLLPARDYLPDHHMHVNGDQPYRNSQTAFPCIEICNTTYRSLRSFQVFILISPCYPTPKILCFAMGQTFP